MPHLLDFLPLRQETLATIRARLDADANAGLDPEDEAFIDTTPGGWYHDITQAVAQELLRFWDMASLDVPAVVFVDFAWGIYLDYHGEDVGLPRKAAAKATGEVTFSGTDALIGENTEVSTIQVDVDEEPVSFKTTEGGTITGTGSITLPVVAMEDGTSGNVAAGAIALLLSPVEGIATIENEDAITGGADVEADDFYRERLKIEKSVAQGAGSVADYRRWALLNASVGFVRVVPLWNGPGTVRVVITDPNNDPVSSTVEDEVQASLDPYTAETTTTETPLTLPDGTIGVVSTVGFADSGRIVIDGDQLVEYTGVTSTTFTGCTGGTGSHAAGTQVVQHGEGKGLAPVGAMVTVDTPAALTVDIDAVLQLRDNYSIDGTDGRIPVQADLEAALAEYVNNLPPGGEDPPGAESPAGSGAVLLNKARAAFFQVEGVYDVDSLELNGAATDLAVGALQVPALGDVTLS